MILPRLYIFLLLALLPATLFADDPKLVPALGWDHATQGGFLTSVTMDAQNAVWVGTEGKGVWRYDPHEKKWGQFTTKDGLGDDDIYALAVDKLGRVWAGHLNHGVSVWNGKKWKNYGVVDGPLGSRVFSIVTCPTDGDVWIATDCGAARYSIANDDWDYFTQASGLPSNQIQAIAFNTKGDIFLGTQCDGIVMANAADKYQKWIKAPGLSQMPDAPAGAGLVSNFINGLIVWAPSKAVPGAANTGLLIAATPLGLSISSDNGDHFNFIRGQDWQQNFYGQYVVHASPDANAAGGRNAQMVNPPRANLLAEDWINCVQFEKETGRLWVGYRNKGLESRDFINPTPVHFDAQGLDSLLVRSIWTGAKTPVLVAVYDEENGGLKTPDDSAVDLDPGDAPPAQAPPLPSVAKPPTTPDSILPLTKRLDVFKTNIQPGEAVYLGDDWSTGGDWVGHYGTSYAVLFGFFDNGIYASEPGFSAAADIGPHHKEAGSGMNTYVLSKTTDNPRVLYSPLLGHRSEGEINDGSYDKSVYPSTWEGPDLCINVEVPEGFHTLSLYFQNNDAHVGAENKLRDYEVQLLASAESRELTFKQTPLAHARVNDFYGGVYKQFIIAGPAKYVVRIARNRSFCTKLQGLFIDRAGIIVTGPNEQKKPLPGFEEVKYAVPDAPDDFSAESNAPLAAAVDLWDKIVALQNRRAVIGLENPLGIWAYRAAVAGKAPEALLVNWRWQLCIWTQEDRDAFDKAMADAYKAYSEKHPPGKKDEPPSN